MDNITVYKNLQDRIREIRGQRVLLDSDVAEIYGVETKRINEAVKNNPEKFPAGYVIELDKTEWDLLKSKYSTSTKGGKIKLPSAFPEKGLYMLATILKSKQATEATLLIIETFTKIRQLSRSIKESSELIGDVFGDDLQISGTKTSIELNLAVLKITHTVMKNKKEKNK